MQWVLDDTGVPRPASEAHAPVAATCPGCGQPVRRRRGPGRAHYAHAPGFACDWHDPERAPRTRVRARAGQLPLWGPTPPRRRPAPVDDSQLSLLDDSA